MTITWAPADADTIWWPICSAEDADSIREMVETTYDDWFVFFQTIDYREFVDRLEHITVNGRRIDMGDDMNSPAIRRIKRIILELKSR
jgi:hypothetical protein